MRTTIKEGLCDIIVDIDDVPSKDQEVFYNPKMELNRSLTILLIKAWDKKEMQMALPLAGSGVRAVRFLKELPQDFIKHIHINDLNKEAILLIDKNLDLNGSKSDKVEVFNLDANKFLENSQGFDYIDIDPFGSPNFLLDNSMRRLSREGLLAVTATDTGALSGAFPSAGRFKYWADTAIIPQKHEIGLRILARKVILMGMQNNKALQPIFSYHHEHYYRIFFKVKKGKTAATEMFNLVNKYYHHCSKCSFSTVNKFQLNDCPNCNNKLIIVGPCFSGNMQDSNFIEKMISINENKKIDKLLNLILEESRVDEVGFFDTHIVCEKNGGNPPKISKLIKDIEDKGYKASKSSIVRNGVKTNYPFKDFVKLISKE